MAGLRRTMAMTSPSLEFSERIEADDRDYDSATEARAGHERLGL